MSDLHLVGQSREAKFINDFEEWKLSINNQFPTAKEAWDEQEKLVKDLEAKLILASDVIKRERKVLADLKEYTEKNLVIMNDLELENWELKGKLDGQETIS